MENGVFFLFFFNHRIYLWRDWRMASEVRGKGEGEIEENLREYRCEALKRCFWAWTEIAKEIE